MALRQNGYVVNMLLGWTVIGWVVALAWSACEDEHHYIPPSTTNTDNNGMISLRLEVGEDLLLAV